MSITNRRAVEPGDHVVDSSTAPRTSASEDAQLGEMRLLVAADRPATAELLERLLRQRGYQNVLTTGSPTEIKELCSAWSPDLILLDLRGLGPLGYEVLDSTASSTCGAVSVPVLVIISETDRAARQEVLTRGARDFVSEPIDDVELLVRLRPHLLTRHLQLQSQQREEALEAAVRERTLELELCSLEGLSVLAWAAEYYEDDTPRHARRVGVTAALLSQALGLPDAFVAAIRNAAPLHDIGKIGVSRRVLLKPDALTEAERAHMMSHVEIGAQILARAETAVLRLGAEIAQTHHERWDGQGYLIGLAGEDIPLSGRIASVADAFDALTHERSYRPAQGADAALAEIKARAGTQFDPQIVQALHTIDLSLLD